MSQSFTFIDAGGNQAQYTIYERNRDGKFEWSTDHGGHGYAQSLELAQSLARTLLKASMAANRRSEESSRRASYQQRW